MRGGGPLLTRRRMATVQHHFDVRRYTCGTCDQRFWTKKDWTSHTQERTCRHCPADIRCVYSKHTLVCPARQAP